MSAKAPSRSSDHEKFSDEQSGYRVNTADPDAEFGGTEARKVLEKKLLWKVDCRMSILVLIYILNYIDRNNAGAARLRGFEADLRLQGKDRMIPVGVKGN
ncbi:putative transporter C11D3.18C [Psilocybe cubensis]|uniref:Transporter C11D3.18C n=2 Tax=Psilocybe cubensis TaxID=181762 RepID=A0ACB8H5S0_PSICU|nr:putative transporter C11D3.18C [Psilocybe cubensis]KAH9483060.1 putative transporter C11D3.18C [Psilocybe cubensis]